MLIVFVLLFEIGYLLSDLMIQGHVVVEIYFLYYFGVRCYLFAIKFHLYFVPLVDYFDDLVIGIVQHLLALQEDGQHLRVGVRVSNCIEIVDYFYCDFS